MSDNNSCSGNCSGCDSNCFTDGENGATVTLNLDDGTDVECAILTIYKAAGRDYIALLPLNEKGENEDGEVYLYRFTLGENSEPSLENIEDDEEYEAASDGFDQWLDDQEFDDLVYEEEES
ncbi:MAG: DUF1292 domain-containing protein [Lachnospiraceae bacterium]|nr:DUF1292 domain-containing protein [Lachnospiraceae bacterium]